MDHSRNAALLRLYIIAFCLTSIFVTAFNYTTFLLAGPEYGLGASQIGLIFLTFAFGMVASTTAGSTLNKVGRRPLLVRAFGFMLVRIFATLLQTLIMILVGISLLTIGFFIAHSVASSAVGIAANGSKGHASSLYLLFYYVGSSVTGSIGGRFWEHGGWSSVAALSGAFAVSGMLMSAFGARVDSGRMLRGH